jgi:hypothetical protein
MCLVYLASNRGRWSSDGWLTVTPVNDSGSATHRTATPWSLLQRGGPGAMVRLSRWGLHLQGRVRDGDSPRVVLGRRRWSEDSAWRWPACSGLRRWHGAWSVALQLDQDHEQLPLDVPYLLLETIWLERWWIGGTWQRLGFDNFIGSWAKSELKGALFIGVLIPRCRGFDILTNLSQNRTRIATDKGKSRKG